METKHDIDDECLHYDDEEISNSSSCVCGLIEFKKSEMFDYNLSSTGSDGGDSEDLFEINLNWKERLDSIREEEECESSTVFSLDINNNEEKIILDDVVYVAVGVDIDGGGSSSMEALSWALKHVVTPYTKLSLIHVFPQVKLIPTPLGKIPRCHVNLEHVDIYLTQKKNKRKLLIQKFINLCVESKVKVEMMLVEGDNVAKAIVDLVANLNIRKLVIGTNQSNLRKLRSRRQTSIADKVLKTIQENCDVKIICEGKEVIDQMINYCTSEHFKDNITSKMSNEIDEYRDFVPIKRLLPNPLWLFRTKFVSP